MDNNIMDSEKTIDELNRELGCISAPYDFYNSPVILAFFKLTETAKDPVYSTPGSYAFDISLDCFNREYKEWTSRNRNESRKLFATDYVIVEPNSRVLLPTGLVFAIPSDHVMKLFIRSSLAIKKGLTLSNSVGIIDSDYRDELFVSFRNDNDTPVILNHGDRIAQAAIEKKVNVQTIELKSHPAKVEGRDGGIGSTGN